MWEHIHEDYKGAWDAAVVAVHHRSAERGHPPPSTARDAGRWRRLANRGVDPALIGNDVIAKPSLRQVHSGQYV